MEIEDKNFIDMVTSNISLYKKHLDPFFNSKEYFQKLSEMENSKYNQDPFSYMFGDSQKFKKK
jgi:hypothetical protein